MIDEIESFGGCMNYFIEGIQGAGKSTLVGKISEIKTKTRLFFTFAPIFTLIG